VTQPGNTTLAAGETAVLKVSGQPTGSLAVELELECKFETKDGKLQLVIVPYSTPPNVARAERAPQRAVLSPPQIKRRKTELSKAASQLEAQLKMQKAQLERLERDEQSLDAVVPMSVAQRNAISQQQLVASQQIAAAETKLEETEAQHNNLAAAAAWYTDMFVLLEQLQNQAKLGLRLFRTVGTERVVIAEPAVSP
jgi:hypothetical protein